MDYGILKWEGSLLIPSFPPFPSPPFPSFPLPCHPLFPPLTSSYRGSVERCELPQWGVGEAPTGNRRRFLTQFRHEEPLLVASNCDIFVQIMPIYQSNTIKSDSVAIIRDTDIVDTHPSVYNMQTFMKKWGLKSCEP